MNNQDLSIQALRLELCNICSFYYTRKFRGQSSGSRKDRPFDGVFCNPRRFVPTTEPIIILYILSTKRLHDFVKPTKQTLKVGIDDGRKVLGLEVLGIDVLGRVVLGRDVDGTELSGTCEDGCDDGELVVCACMCQITFRNKHNRETNVILFF